MHTKEARRILNDLILGHHPETGNPIPADDITHNSDVIRALLIAAGALDATAARAVRRAQLPENVGRTWSDEEDARLTAGFKAGTAADVLASDHKRTLRAIESRLVRLGLMRPADRITEVFGGPSGRPPNGSDSAATQGDSIDVHA